MVPGRCRVRAWEPGVKGRGPAVPFNVCNGQEQGGEQRILLGEQSLTVGRAQSLGCKT